MNNEQEPNILTQRVDQLTPGQEKDVKSLMQMICAKEFKKHTAAVADGVTLIFDEPYEYYDLPEIEKALGFLPTNDLLLKYLADEVLKYGTVVDVPNADQNIYVYFASGHIDDKYLRLMLTANYVEKPKARKKIFGIF